MRRPLHPIQINKIREYVVQGYGYRRIAKALKLKESTVKKYVRKIKQELGTKESEAGGGAEENTPENTPANDPPSNPSNPTITTKRPIKQYKPTQRLKGEKWA